MKLQIGIIGSGWRAHCYMRVIRAFSHRMEVAGVLVHSSGSRLAMEQEYPGRIYTDLEQFLQQPYTFVMVMVPGAEALTYNAALMRRGIPVLSETPPGFGVEELNRCYAEQQETGAKIQVTEQCHLRPYYRAVEALTGSGKLGKIWSIHMGILHDYHAMSIIRRNFGAGFANCRIDARAYSFPVHYHCGREGLHAEAAQNIIQDRRKRADIVFETGQTAFYDFSDEQYFNYFRKRHLFVQGELGEIADQDVAYLGEDGLPVTGRLLRDRIGEYENLEGCGLRSLQLNGQVLYRNPYLQEDVRLNDDEIAMAQILDGMAAYVGGGEEIYPLREALQDTYLHLMLDESIRLGQPIETTTQSWG